MSTKVRMRSVFVLVFCLETEALGHFGPIRSGLRIPTGPSIIFSATHTLVFGTVCLTRSETQVHLLKASSSAIFFGVFLRT